MRKSVVFVAIIVVSLMISYTAHAEVWSPIGTWDIELSGDHFVKLAPDNFVLVETINEYGTITIETDSVLSARITLISTSAASDDGPFMGLYNADDTFSATRAGNNLLDNITGSIDINNRITGLFHLEDLDYGQGADLINLSYSGVPVPVPLPASVWILGSGLAGLAGLRVGRKKK